VEREEGELVKDRIDDQTRESEWEPIKIFSNKERTWLIPQSQLQESHTNKQK
jgi:hypothetical protein